jgi:glycosyltransferase involved in cell wall biosynthesis
MITCIIPARNESGSLMFLVKSISSIENISKIIIVEGGSQDDTWEQALKIAQHNKKVLAIKQLNTGKFDAVLSTSNLIETELFIIWDADATVDKNSVNEMITRAIISGNVVIGDRLRGNIAPGAMQLVNYFGNWFFAFLWAPILQGKVNDLLCGSKIFPTKILNSIPDWLIKNDPYGDFALMAVCRKLNMEFLQVNYSARLYGETNINRWEGAFRLIKVTFWIYFNIFLKRI